MRRSLNKIKYIVISLLLLALIVPGLQHNGAIHVIAQGEAQNCVVTPEQLDGQANAIVAGASGGATTQQVPADQVVDPRWIAKTVAVIGDPSTAYRGVQLAIIDDFSNPTAHGNYVYAVTVDLINRTFA